MSQIIEILSKKIKENQEIIQNWFDQKFQETPPIFYNSVDLRHSGFKIAPIDTNCFPAGFNNIKNSSLTKAKEAAQNYIQKYFGENVKKILIIPENHTRNINYLKNIQNLQEILQTQQNQVVIGSMLEEISTKTNFQIDENNEITLHKITKTQNQVTTQEGFKPDLIILNNDLTSGFPEILKNIETPISPSPALGWFQRSKTEHFEIYSELAKEICKLVDIDPWLISPINAICEEVDFKQSIGFQCLAREVEILLNQIRKKYEKHQINSEPYCYIKADNGTYGMAVMQVKSSEEALTLNKKERKKMNMLKESKQNTIALIQEGISTIDKINEMSAEPMIYMIGGEVVGNLMRANESRDHQQSLNAAGANFFDLEDLADEQLCLGCKKENVKLIYSFIAKIAALASAKEIQNYDK